MFSMLATRLMDEGKADSAFQVVQRVEKVIPPATLPHSYNSGSMDLARVWERLGQKSKVEEIVMPIGKTACEYIEWYLAMPSKMLITNDEECMYYMYQLHAVADILQRIGSDKAIDVAMKLNEYNTTLRTRLYGNAPVPEETPQAPQPMELPTEE
jgi:hypothetical protein